MFNKPIVERLLDVLSHKCEKLFDLFLVKAKKLAWKSQIFADTEKWK